MTVWVVNSTRDDVSAAEIYGSKRLVNVRYVYPDDIANNRISSEFMDNMYRCASEFSPQHDYVLIVGDHLQLIQFTSLIAKLHGSYRVLRFDREANGYYPVIIDIGTKHGQEIGEESGKGKGGQAH